MLVVDQRAFGGQAGASARIENYLGFPTGISGMALAGRAFNQALKFGAEIAIPIEAVRLDCGEPGKKPTDSTRLEFSNGGAARARTVVIASGARYRRPPISNLSSFEGRGVSYWASPVEAKLCEGEEVALVGGGNSAGQAVVFLASKVKRLHLVVRGPSLEASMSRYLVDRIAALPNVELHTGTEVVALEGDEVGLRRRRISRARHWSHPQLLLASPFPIHRRRPERRVAQWLRCIGRQGVRNHRARQRSWRQREPPPCSAA